jgi:hypothetical protein
LKIAPQSHDVSILSGIGSSDCFLILSNTMVAGIALGIAQNETKIDITKWYNRSMFLVGDIQNPASNRIIETRDRIPRKRPPQRAVRRVFHPFFENGEITRPTVTQVRIYPSTILWFRKPSKDALSALLPLRMNHKELYGQEYTESGMPRSKTMVMEPIRMPIRPPIEFLIESPLSIDYLNYVLLLTVFE